MKKFFRTAALLCFTAFTVFAAYHAEYTLYPKISLAMAQNEKPITMAVLMYHSVVDNEAKAGSYVITPAAFRKDLEYLKNEGYTTVVMADLIDYVKNGTPLPEKPVMLTFDDGYYNNYLHVFPLLKEYNMKAVVSIICRETDRYSELNENRENYSHLTWEMINEMIDSGLVEFQNHTYDLHKLDGPRRGVGKNDGESTAVYCESIRADIERAQQRYQEMTGWTPTTFTYPFGTVSSDSYSVLKELNFSASFDAQGKPFHLTRDPECLWRIPRYNRPWGTTAEEILRKAFSPG